MLRLRTPKDMTFMGRYATELFYIIKIVKPEDTHEFAE